MLDTQHYLVVGVDGDTLIWQWMCDGHEGSPCRPDGRCQLIDCWYGMSDHGAYRINGDTLDLISFTGNLTGGRFMEDDAGTDTLTFRMQDEYMELLVNGTRVNDVSCNIHQVGVFPVRAFEEEYIEHLGDEDPGAFWEPSGDPLRLLLDHRLWPQLLALRWDYQADNGAERDTVFRELRSLMNL